MAKLGLVGLAMIVISGCSAKAKDAPPPPPPPPAPIEATPNMVIVENLPVEPAPVPEPEPEPEPAAEKRGPELGSPDPFSSDTVDDDTTGRYIKERILTLPKADRRRR